MLYSGRFFFPYPHQGSRNESRALRIGQRIYSGSVVINDWGLAQLVQSLPMGGVKISGFGKFNGPEGLRYTIWSDRLFL